MDGARSAANNLGFALGNRPRISDVIIPVPHALSRIIDDASTFGSRVSRNCATSLVHPPVIHSYTSLDLSNAAAAVPGAGVGVEDIFLDTVYTRSNIGE